MKLIVEDDKYIRIADMLRTALPDADMRYTVTMYTQELANTNIHKHRFDRDCEIMIRSDRLFIIMEHSCTVIDLRLEQPFRVMPEAID